MMLRAGMMAVAVLAAGAAAADPLAGKAAKKAVFPAKGVEVEIIEGTGLDKTMAKALAMVARDYPYYGAVAIAPDEELLKSKATILVGNYHTVEAASAKAVAECDRLRQGGSPCVVAALIRPKGWKARDISLSAAASAALKDSYPAKGPAALAISGVADSWGIATGEGAAEAAVADCAAKLEGVTDCAVVVAD